MNHEDRAESPGPALPDVKMHLHTPADPGVAVLVENTICTARKAASFVRHIAIDVSKTRLAGQCRVGQAFGVLPPGIDEHGKPHKLRLYSIASPTRGEDGEGNVISTTVKRVIDEHWERPGLFLGVASNYLCDLREGDELKVTGPNGKRFLLPATPEEHDYLFFATGTGIAPFRGMVTELLDTGITSSITLVMGSAYATDLLYHADFMRLAAEHRNFRYLTAISREKQEDGHDRMYVQDRLDTNREELLPILAGGRALIYICGLAGMELGIFQKLTGMLRPDALEQFLHMDPEVAADPSKWDRRMINRQVRPTRRVFMEVY